MRENAKPSRASKVGQKQADLGTALRALRLSAGMTLQQVSTEAGVSLRYLSQAENGLVNVSDGWVRLVAEAIGLHIATSTSDLAATG